MKFTFKIGEKIKEAWPMYKDNFSMFFLMGAIVFFLEILGSKNFVLYILVCVASLLVGYMVIRYILSLVDKKDFNPFVKSSLPTLGQIWNLLKTYVLFILIVAGAFILVLFPTIFYTLKTGAIYPWTIALLIFAILLLIASAFCFMSLALFFLYNFCR